MTTDRVTQVRQAPVFGGEGRIIAQLALELERAHGVEFAVQCGVESQKTLVGVAVGHASALKVLASMARARASLDITVPTGVSVASAISRYERPLMSRITSVSRKGDGRPAIALRKSLAVFKGDQLLFGIGRRVVALAQIERIQIRQIAGVSHSLAPVAGHEGHSGVAHDGEKPGLRPIDRNGGESLERTQRGVLHDVLGVGWAVRQPFGE